MAGFGPARRSRHNDESPAPQIGPRPGGLDVAQRDLLQVERELARLRPLHDLPVHLAHGGWAESLGSAVDLDPGGAQAPCGEDELGPG
jgi:hypothetical protein